MLGCLIVLRPYDPVAQARASVAICNQNDSRVTGLGGTAWEPSVTVSPSIGMQFWNGDFEQSIDPGQVAFAFNMHQTRRSFPDLMRYVWVGADIEVRVGRVGDVFANWPIRFAGKVVDYAGADYPNMAIRGAVDLEPLRADVLKTTYAGTTGIEGGPDIKNRLKPLVLGPPRNVEPVLIDVVNNVYQFSAYGPIERVDSLYERGSQFPGAVGDAPNFNALVAADIPNGSWATCLAFGLIRLGAPAAGVITGDIRGHRIGATSPRLAGAQVQALAQIAEVPSSLLLSSGFTAMDAEGATASDIVITEQVNFLDAARRLVLPCNWQVLVSNLGILTPIKPSLVAAPSLTLDMQGRSLPLVKSSTEQPVSAPYYRTIMAAERNWRVQTTDETAFQAPLVDRGAYDNDEIYREGNYVKLPDGSQWIYINTAPSKGNAPPAGTNGDSYWSLMSGPISTDWENVGNALGTKPEDNATVGAPPGTPVGDRSSDDLLEQVDLYAILLAQLDADTAQALIDIGEAKQTVADIQNGVSGLADQVLAAEGQIETFSQTLGEQGARITTLQTTADTQAGQLASLQTSLSTTNANVSINASAITGLNSSVSQLSTTVSTQGSSITTNAQAITSLQGTVATLTTQVTAGEPNLSPNGGLENGTNGLTFGGDGWLFANTLGYGPHVYVTGNRPNDVRLVIWPEFPCGPNIPVVMSGDLFTDATSGIAYIELGWKNAAGVWAAVPGGSINKALGLGFASNQNDRIRKATTTPAGCQALRVVGFASNITRSSGQATIAYRRIKVERGTAMSAFSSEASVSQSFQALSTLNTQYASLSTEVSTQGVRITSQQTAITTVENGVNTLFGRLYFGVDVDGRIASMTINNSGQASNVKFAASALEIGDPDNNSGFHYSNGRIRVSRAGSFMKVIGDGFGSADQFIEWYGPYQSNFANCTEANAVSYLKTNGDAYFGGSLSTGTFRNSITGTALTDPAYTILGPFGTNGNPKSVNVSAVYNYSQRFSSGPNITGGTPSLRVTFYRSRDGNNWTQISQNTYTGTTSAEPASGADPGRLSITTTGSFTYTDTGATGTQPLYYQVRIDQVVLPSWSGSASAAPTITQRATIISTE